MEYLDARRRGRGPKDAYLVVRKVDCAADWALILYTRCESPNSDCSATGRCGVESLTRTIRAGDPPRRQGPIAYLTREKTSTGSPSSSKLSGTTALRGSPGFGLEN